LSRSWNAMKGSWFMAALFMLVLAIIALLSAIPCLLGLLATVPMFMIIASLMYRDMIGMPQTQMPVAPAYSYHQSPTPGSWPPPPTQNPGDQTAGGPEAG
ncbi:MAG TPA: hypothetical protein VFW40_04850, partial [Capsulimonadaceae bacterium]|nr:hypothetical protein [Capsulimonadaceae bacterium]